MSPSPDQSKETISNPIPVVGFMSGTSMDGLDAAYVITDGEQVDRIGPALTIPMPRALRAQLSGIAADAKQRGLVEEDAALQALEQEFTVLHARAVADLLEALPDGWPAPVLLGMHGQTLLHRPEAGITYQLGDAPLLADLTGMDVVSNFRSADVAAGGQGAPLVPLVHQAFARSLPESDFPVLVINLGGVANVTWIDHDGTVIACDTGPANGPCDDWMARQTGAPMDRAGRAALAGTADRQRIAEALTHPFFARKPPKSLDRFDFTAGLAEGLSTEDGAATLIEFAAAAVVQSQSHMPRPPQRRLVTGGGRHNPAFMAALTRRFGSPVEPVEAVGWDGDALEAQAFAILAVRSRRGLPLTVPGSTGVPHPVSGGDYAPAAKAGSVKA